MATKRLRPVHPGDILAHDFMGPLKLSSYKLAKELGVSVPTVNEIVRRRRAVTAEIALRLRDTSARLRSYGRTYRADMTWKLRARRLARKSRELFTLWRALI